MKGKVLNLYESNIKNRILCLLFMNSVLLGMSDDKIITRPYQAPWSVRYPRIASTGVALLTGASSFVLQSQYENQADSNDFVAPVIAGLTALSVVKACMRRQKKHLVDSLIVDPSVALRYLYDINSKFDKEFQQLDVDAIDLSDRYRKLVHQYEQECPIFLLKECTSEGVGACLLSREYCSHYRNGLEGAVSCSLLKKLANGDRVNYTDFGSGGAFQSLVTLVKTLSKKPNAKIDMHLIDIKHTPYVAGRDFLDMSRELKSDDNHSLDSAMELLVQHARKEWGLKKISTSRIKKRIKFHYLLQETSKQQVIKWLTKTFPDAQLSLFLHDTVASYLDYLNRHKTMYPDVVSAADIQDDMSDFHKSVINYTFLCARTLQKKPLSENFLLGIDNEKHRGIIINCSLQNLPGSVKEQLQDLQTGEVTPIYTIESPIYSCC